MHTCTPDRASCTPSMARMVRWFGRSFLRSFLLIGSIEALCNFYYAISIMQLTVMARQWAKQPASLASTCTPQEGRPRSSRRR